MSENDEWYVEIVRYDLGLKVYTSDNIHCSEFRGSLADLTRFVDETAADIRKVYLIPVKYTGKLDPREVPKIDYTVREL